MLELTLNSKAGFIRIKGEKMKLYNTYSQKTEEIKPIEEGKISMYVCGPTVYNYPHIGNARPIVVFDTLVNTLEALGYDVTYASNYTDVDDKIINKAIEDGVTEKDITDRYIEAYAKTRQDLNARQPDYAPRVTETMDHIISFIDELVKNGSAYQSGNDVYYRVSSDPHYGELSHQKVDDLMVGARIDENENKESPLDFTLWKKTDRGIQWDSPWGKGRPGWHTECVVMIQDVFKKPLIDIHGGGMDLKFPHHENEVAQCRSIHDSSLANMWVHNGMINIDNEKMSKSLGNVLWAKDLIEQYGGPVIRWMMVSTHYRAPLNLNEEALQNAAKEIKKVEKPVQQALLQLALRDESSVFNSEEAHYQEFISQMADDLNTPNAITALMAAVKELNTSLRQREPDMEKISVLTGSILKMMDILGVEMDVHIPDETEIQTWKDWKAAVKEKDFEKADSLRAVLMEAGLV